MKPCGQKSAESDSNAAQSMMTWEEERRWGTFNVSAQKSGWKNLPHRSGQNSMELLSSSLKLFSCSSLVEACHWELKMPCGEFCHEFGDYRASPGSLLLYVPPGKRKEGVACWVASGAKETLRRKVVRWQQQQLPVVFNPTIKKKTQCLEIAPETSRARRPSVL